VVIRWRSVRSLAVVLGAVLVAGGLSACLPHEDEGWGWNIQQLVVEPGYEPRVGGPVSAVAVPDTTAGVDGAETAGVPNVGSWASPRRADGWL
jgi:hypothetical protein